MKIRVAKKIVKNQESLQYKKGQIQKAKKVVKRYESKQKV